MGIIAIGILIVALILQILQFTSSEAIKNKTWFKAIGIVLVAIATGFAGADTYYKEKEAISRRDTMNRLVKNNDALLSLTSGIDATTKSTLEYNKELKEENKQLQYKLDSMNGLNSPYIAVTSDAIFLRRSNDSCYLDVGFRNQGVGTAYSVKLSVKFFCVYQKNIIYLPTFSGSISSQETGGNTVAYFFTGDHFDKGLENLELILLTSCTYEDEKHRKKSFERCFVKWANSNNWNLFLDKKTLETIKQKVKNL